MLPLLKLAADGKEHSNREALEKLAADFALTEEEKSALLPSGHLLFRNRVAWAKVYLQQAGLLVSSRRGHFEISDRGRAALGENLKSINVKYLERFPEFLEFRTPDIKPKTPISETQKDGEHQTPEEMLESAYQRLRADLVAELSVRLKNCSPQFFERLVVEVILKMGYGGSRKEAGEAIGMAGDEGIDGIINEDRLGLDVIYIQAKKWEGSVGRPEIQKFVGALHGKRAKKGVFITTSTFSAEATEYVARIEPRVVLIDGHLLAKLMIDFDIGVTPVSTYETKKIDSDYFSEE